MELHQYDGRLLRELTAAYNCAIRKVPHCYPVSVCDFHQAVAPAAGGVAHPERHSEAVFLMLDEDSADKVAVAGFIHVAIGHPRRNGLVNPDDPEMGIIRFFWYRPGCRPIGAALLDKAEAYSREQLAQTATPNPTPGVFAFPNRHVYPFYHLISAYLSDRLGHVESLLALRGYERAAGEVYLDWRNFDAKIPDPDPYQAHYTIDYPTGRGRRPGVVVCASAAGQEIGICQNFSAAEYSRARPNQDWIFTKWLGVSQEYQGRGLGRALLQRALNAAREVGYRHAAISTSWKNHRALTFYSNFGYEIVDWTYGFIRTLD